MTPQSQQFGRYSLLRKIGEGGMAEVFLATVAVAEGLHKRVVVKKIRRDCAGEPEYARMFVDEAKIALGLNHANIVQVFDFGQVDGDFYLAMELVEGVDLMRLIHAVHAQGERIPRVIAAYIVHQVAAGLAYAHQKRDDFGAPIGIVHRDISPHNVMLSFAGTVKILDFGIARPVAAAGAPPRRRARPGEREEETIQGKVAYMAPEQALGHRVDPRADLYALGIVLYEMLTGALVYRGRSITTLLEEVRTRSLPAIDAVVPDLEPELGIVASRALARDPDARWESARAMQSALASFLHRADPVVDDEVLSHYVGRWFGGVVPATARDEGDLEATRELSEVAGDGLEAAPHRDERAVVLLRAVLADHADHAGHAGHADHADHADHAVLAVHAAPTERARVDDDLAPRAVADPDRSERDRGRERFLALAQAVAYKREAHVIRLGAAAITLAFGVHPFAQSPAAEALRVALALREAIGEAAPGIEIGVAIARAPVHVHRLAGSALVVEVEGGLDRHLASIAASALDGAVMLVGEIADELGRSWHLGEPALHGSDASLPVLSEFDASTRDGGAAGPPREDAPGSPAPRRRSPSAPAVLAPWSSDLERVTPVLGPQSAIDRRIHHAPGARVALHGRELELKALRDGFVEAIRTRSARAVLIRGEAGLGKRTLLERFIAQIPRGAAQILRLSGQWRRRNVSLGALQGLLERFLAITPGTTRGEVEARLRAQRIADAGELAGVLAAALGLPGSERDESDPRERREAQGRLFQRLVAALAQRRPVLVVLEALHYVDEQSLDLVATWLRGAPNVPVLVAMTSRPSARSGLLHGIPGLSEIELRELDERARHELIVRRFEDPEEADELAQAILARTAGNPLFIEETLAMLLRQGVVGWDAQGRYLVVRQRGARIEVPPSVEAALCTRLDALDPADREVVEAAAILGQSFRPAEVDQLVSRSSSRALARLCDLGVFEPDPAGAVPGALRFTSVSLHELCKQAMAPTLAERLHGHAVAIRRARLDYRPGRDDGPIADHLVLAGRPEEAIEPALRAARAARELAGNVEAHYFLSLALRALPADDPRRFEVLAEREPILRAWGHRRLQSADIRQMIELAIARGDPDEEVAASLRLLRFYLECERTTHAEQLIPRIEARLAAVSDPAPFLAILGELRADLLLARGDLDGAERIARQA
ncbi:MAG: protein kinase, partial [Nannocystaceae bacterium]